MKPRIYDTKAACEIVAARASLTNLRADWRELVKTARLSKPMTKLALQALNAAEQVAVEGDGMCNPDLRVLLKDDWAEIWLYDAIDTDYGIAAIQVVDGLAECGDLPVRLFINSPGGDCWESQAMRANLARHEPGVTAYIDGIAASAATTVSLGAKEIYVMPQAEYMIHRCWGGVSGNCKELRAYAQMCEDMDGNIASGYAAKTGKSAEDILEMMDGPDGGDGTFMSGEDAVEMGFCDALQEFDEPEDDEPEPPVDLENERQNRARTLRQAIAFNARQEAV